MGTTKSIIKSGFVLGQIEHLKTAGYKVYADKRTHDLLSQKELIFSNYADNHFIKFQKGRNKLYVMSLRAFAQELPKVVQQVLWRSAKKAIESGVTAPNAIPVPF